MKKSPSAPVAQLMKKAVLSLTGPRPTGAPKVISATQSAIVLRQAIGGGVVLNSEFKGLDTSSSQAT
jgi:hypothetical protein